MRLRGAATLSSAELLAILLGCGTGGKNVMEVAQELMIGCGGKLTALPRVEPARARRHGGLEVCMLPFVLNRDVHLSLLVLLQLVHDGHEINHS